MLEYLESINKTSQLTMQDLVRPEYIPSLIRTADRGCFFQFNIYEPQKMRSTPGVRSDLFNRPPDKALLTDFFGGVSQAEVVAEESIESHTMFTATEKVSHANAGEPKSRAVGPSAVKVDSFQKLSTKGDGIPSAAIRAWAGAGFVGLFIAWITIGASRSP